MGTLQTEIQKTLKSWEPLRGLPQPEVLTKDDTPVPRKVFEYVKINPSCMAKDISRDLNINTVRVSSALLYLLQKGKVGRKEYLNPSAPKVGRKNIFCYWAEVGDYEDESSKVTTPKKQKKAPKASPKVKKLLKELDEPQVKKPKSVVQPKLVELSAQEIVSKLTVYEAKNVYELLKKVFQ